MEEKKAQPTTIDEYIARFPEDVQRILSEVRAVVHETAPEAVETISYQMPAFFLNGILVWFGGFKNHLGFYPRASTIETFRADLAGYTTSKGAVQFPYSQPIPYDIIRKIVRYRVAENSKK